MLADMLEAGDASRFRSVYIGLLLAMIAYMIMSTAVAHLGVKFALQTEQRARVWMCPTHRPRFAAACTPILPAPTRRRRSARLKEVSKPLPGLRVQRCTNYTAQATLTIEMHLT